jgi:glycosyltransferase involved in cell wall biosynthesis
MKRVLHVTECYAGGVSRAIDTVVALAPEFEHHLLWEGDEEPVDDGSFASLRRLPRSFVSRIVETRRAIDALEPDIVHAHSSWAGVYARVLPQRAPIIYEPHCYKFDDPAISTLTRSFYRTSERVLLPRTAAVVVLSPHEERLTREMSSSVRTFYLPNAPSVQPDHDRAAARDVDEVVMIGRISAQKDPSYFIDIARSVRSERPDTVFTWIGDGDSEARAQLEAAGVGVTGWLDGAGVREILSRGVVYVHSARYEGFPLSVLDAAAFGLAIVVRDIPAFDGTPLLRATSAQELGRIVADLLSDPAVDADVRERSARLLETMNVDRQAEALRTVYSSLIEGAVR